MDIVLVCFLREFRMWSVVFDRINVLFNIYFVSVDVNCEGYVVGFFGEN